MKRQNLIKSCAILLTGLMVACSSESIPVPDEPVLTTGITNLSPQRACIEKYIEKNKPATRAGEYTVTPYIENGDTLMYVVQYADGWELFSNSFTMPMSLMKNDTGTFAEAVAGMNPALQAMYGGILQLLRNDMEEENPEMQDGATQWNAYSVQVSPGTGSGSNEPVYTLVGTKSYPRVTTYIPHLITTEWYQSSPLNSYMPYQRYKNTEHILVGCVPVATGQFLKYCHDVWCKKMSTPSKADYNSNLNTYSFSNFTENQWPYMTKDGFVDFATPLFLGWIAKEIGVTPIYNEDKENTGTAADFGDAAAFITKQTGYPTKCISYDSSKAINMLLNEEPVPLWLLNSNNSQSGGHVVIIDEINYLCDETDYYYAYVIPNSSTTPDPTIPPGPSTSPDADYNQLVAQYGQVYTEKQKDIVAYFRFAWGWFDSEYKYNITDYDKFNNIEVNGNLIKDIFIEETEKNGEKKIRNYYSYKMITYTR